jgi:Demethylmenaquinone methyltransferase
VPDGAVSPAGAGHENLAWWRAFGTATVSDSLGRQGALAARIRPRTVTGFVGRAHCVRVVVGDSGTLHRALEEVTAGSVLMIDAGGFEDRAVWGEVLSVAAMERGVVAVVVDGAIRDVAAIRERGLPVYSSAICPAGPHKAAGGTSGGTISCGGVVVATGDLVLGDEDGVVVVPWAQRHEVAEAAQRVVEREIELVARIRTGASTAEYFGLSETKNTGTGEIR